MQEFVARQATSERHVLAEGPVWVPQTSTILWIDVERGHVFEGHLDGAGAVAVDRRIELGETIGAVVRADDGRLLVAARHRLVVLHPDGTRTPGPVILPDGAPNRTNDGGCDPAGRFLIGTLSLEDRTGDALLARVEDDGSLTTIDADLTLSNGLAWSADGLLYHVDSSPGLVWVRPYDAATGAVGPRREHLHLSDGYPDGICLDAQGFLWVAVWGAGQVRRYAPDGEHVATVHVDAPHPSSVAFVGAELDVLLITSASRDLSPAERDRYPGAGGLWVADVGVPGLPVPAWAGRG